MADLVVVSGPPGAGKSTVARLVSRMFDPSARLPGDDFFGFIEQGFIAPWTDEASRQNEVVVRAAAVAAGMLAFGGYTVVYDGVIGPWFLETFLRSTRLRSLHYAVLLPAEHACLYRVRSRSGHGFTDADATHDMYQEFVDSDIDPRHVITSMRAPAQIASMVFERVQSGSLVWSPEPD